ncbi:MAG: hypothetical protein PWP65_1783 [Clostridia bacterium]|nr:hypothetical protein [Clostridia bacterium]
MSDNEIVKEVLRELKKNEFNAYYAQNGDEARKLVLEMIPEGASVGIGGSLTIRNLGLVEALRQKGYKIYDHWDETLTPEELKQTFRNQRTCDVFLCSTNAITRDGQLINLDGSGNRVSSMIFGPQKIIVVAGINKIVENVEQGIHRVKNVVAPENYRRRNSPAPCAKTGHCIDCRPPAKQCRALVILEARPRISADFNVVLVGEELGI